MPLKKLVFSQGLLDPTLVGDKCITIRRYRAEAHTFVAGEEFVGDFKDGVKLMLRATADTEVKMFCKITDEEAQNDGFDHAMQLFIGMKEYYHDLALTDTAGIIRFEICVNEEGYVIEVE